MTKDNIKRMGDATLELDSIKRYLISLSISLNMTGNTVLSKELLEVSEDLNKAIKEVGDTWSDELNHRFNETTKRTGEILEMALEHSLGQINKSLPTK